MYGSFLKKTTTQPTKICQKQDIAGESRQSGREGAARLKSQILTWKSVCPKK
jgi:hypothetical protein